MPRVAIDFSKTVIYHFVCKDEMIKCSYVGSTTNFVKRKATHKCSFHNDNKNHLKLYQTIRENGGWDNWELKPLEEFPCENKTQQVIREQFWIDQFKPDLNSRTSYTHPEIRKEIHNTYTIEWRKNNQDKVKEQQTKYRKEHKEEAKVMNSKYYATHKDDEEYKAKQAERVIKYREEHKEEVKKYNAKYTEEHKANEDFKEKQRQRQRKFRAKLQASQNIHIDPSSMPVSDCQDPVEGSH